MLWVTTFLLIASSFLSADCLNFPSFSLCSGNYTENPFFPSCFRLVSDAKSWDDAKEFCENDDEYLAVLDTVDILNWFEHIRRTKSEWKNAGWLWIGGRRNGTEDWFWNGRITTELVAADWDDSQPDGSGPCLQVFDGGRKYKWEDWGCSNKNNFVCEKDMTRRRGPKRFRF